MSIVEDANPSTAVRIPTGGRIPTGVSFPTGISIAVGLAVWLAIVWLMGTSGILTAPATQPFRPVLFSVLVPVLAFLAVYAGSLRIRKFMLAIDMRLLTMLQLWRVLGFGFLTLYAHDVLPGLFAWPAGLGDVAIGLTAPLAVWALIQRPNYAKSGRFIAFNLLGILDFVVAAGTATLASGAYLEFHTGLPTSAPMEVWPLNIFPGFIVPLFMFAHLTVLFQVNALRQQTST